MRSPEPAFGQFTNRGCKQRLGDEVLTQLLFLFMRQVGVEDVELQPTFLDGLGHFVHDSVAGHQEEGRRAFRHFIASLLDEVLVEAVSKY